MDGLGIHANVSHVKAERNVGSAGDLDFYATLQDALTSCTFDDIVVRMLKDEALAAEVTPPAGRVLVIDGNGKHTLSRLNARIITVTNSTVTIRDLNMVGEILMNTLSDFVCRVVDCEMSGRLYLFRGTVNSALYITRSKIVGASSLAFAIRIDDADPAIIVEDSYLSGYTAQSAVHYVVTNDNLKMRRSKCFHGSLGVNNPFGRAAAQTPSWRGYQNDFNADPDSFGWSTNLVAAGQQQSSFDANTDFF